MSISTGTQIGPYRVVSQLGVGGMGEVYRAHDPKLGREVAIKILPAAVAIDPERLARFDREARLLASLNHPHIGAIYGVEETAGVRALILELVEGETLADLVERGPVPVAEALEIAQQIADALDAAHERGVIHRDLKPANIKRTPEGVVKVLDFGLAKVRARDASDVGLTQSPTITSHSTIDGVLLGTASYMSPEQARGRAADKRSDIWAFGCVLFELLTGQRAFPGESTSDAIAAVLAREPEWNAIPSNVTPNIRRLLQRCLEKDPKHRLRDIGDAKLDLVADRSVGESSVPARQAVRWSTLGTIAAVLAAAAIVSWWALGRSDLFWQNPLANARFTRFTDFEGSELDAAISPDGKFVVFLSNTNGPFDAWVGEIGRGAFVNVTKGQFPELLNDEIRNIGFTADDDIWVRFNRTDSTGRVLTQGTRTVPMIGGAFRTLLDVGINPIWSPDGSELLYHEPAPGDPIFIADRNGRNARRIFVAQPGVHCHYLTWSPDGRFVYFVSGIPPNEMDIWRVSAAGGSAEQITRHNSNVAYPTFMDDRVLLYRATSGDGSGPWLFGLDVHRRIPHRASLGVEQYLSISATSSGRRLVATVSNPTGGLWAVPLSDRTVDESSARRVTVPTVTATAPRLGPDYLLYLSSKAGPNGLWIFKNGAATELWQPAEGGLTVPPAVAPDGHRICFAARRNGKSSLYVMDADGTNVRPLSEALDLHDSPSWAPDGKWIAVSTEDQLVKIPVDGGPAIQLVKGLSRMPVWSADGRFILYSASLQGPGYPVKAVTPDGAPYPIPPLWIRRGVDRYRVTRDSKRVVYLGGDYGAQDFFELDLATGARHQLTSLQRGFSIRGFDLTWDGREILFDRVKENSDVVLIDLPPK